MSDIVIKAENLGKKYTIGHQAENGNYTALRDVLMQSAGNLWHKTKDLVQGKPVIQGDTMEEVWALKDVNFEIRRGEVVGIIGRNGAGKSTLLKVLSRITEPSAGRVAIKGRVASLLEVGTGFHPELTGRENIYLNGAIMGMARQEIKNKFDEIVAFAEVEKFLDTPVKRFSSGMYIRLAFAVTAHLESEILLVDEVLAVGDVMFQKKCLGKIKNVVSAGRTVLFVSHNMVAIKNLCENVLWLNSGRISKRGKSEEIVSEYINTAAENHSELYDFINNQDRNEDFVLNRLNVLQNEIVTNCIENGNSFEVHIEYTLNKNIRGFRIYYDIVDSDGNILIRTYHDDDSDFEQTMKAGSYISRSIFPSRLLAPHRYILVVRATIESTSKSYKCFLPNGIEIPLNISWTSKINRSRPNARIISKLQPHIIWQTQKI